MKRVIGVLAVLCPIVAAGALAATAGAPTASGPLTLSSGGCQAASSCAFDYALDPTATADPKDSWHAFWVSTATSKMQPGWCEIDAIATLSWGDAGSVGNLPAATYPQAGSSLWGARAIATLMVDASGSASTPGRLEGVGMPAGLVTTWVHPGYMTALWQGRAAIDPSLVMAAAISDPTGGSPSPPARANDYSVGLPCNDFAPPGRTFLARFTRSTIRAGQTAFLELRIPETGLRWILTSKLNEQTAVDGEASVQLVGGLGGLTTRSKPQTLHFADRYTFETKPSFGTWVAIVTLKGPTGTRHFRLRLTVKA